MKEEHKTGERRLKRKIKLLEVYTQTSSGTVPCRRQWFASTDDMQAEYEKRILALQTENRRLYERCIRTESQRDKALDQCTQLRHEKYALATELEEEKGKNQKLAAQLNQDFENSFLPSSAQAVRKKKIPNNREPSGKKPSVQLGHTGHSQKKQ